MASKALTKSPPSDLSPALDLIPTESAYSALVRGELDVQISTARAYPRDVSRALSQALGLVSASKDTAEECIYALPRDGKMIQGPSARFAEVVAMCWGNLRIAARVVGIDEHHATCQAVAHDLEGNVARSVEVKRKVRGKNGRPFSEDMVTMTCNAGCSIASRNAILQLVPKAFWAPVFDRCLEVAKTDKRPLAAQRQAALEAFGRLRVSPERLCALVDKPNLEAITPQDLVTLRAIYQSVQEGSLSPESLRGEPAKTGPNDEGPDLDSLAGGREPGAEG